ncbi:MAG: phosphatase PAP2 family protein [Flavobacteriaceae bacterium]|nr:phosphatase PAP2 family protein [Flavobacteriaceae bacterium]
MRYIFDSMQQFHLIIQEIRPILTKFKIPIIGIYGLFLIGSGLLLFLFGKSESYLMINRFHHPYLDVLFKYITHLGDGAWFAILAVLFAWRKRLAVFWYFVGAGVLTGLVTYLFKHYLFDFEPRPGMVFRYAETLHLVDGMRLATWNSFPSGHTCSAFVYATLLIWLAKSSSAQYLYLSLAILVGMSRVYLSQHFVRDILVGSMLGIGIAIASLYIVNKLYAFTQKRKQ